MNLSSILERPRSARATRGSGAARKSGVRAGFRPGLEPLEDRCLLSANVITHWNEILMQTLATHTGRIPLARNMAIVHVAMFDAVNAIDRSYEPYHANVQASHGASLEAAAAQAARDTLTALYPARQAIFDAALAEDLAGIPEGLAQQGIAIGQETARQILELRSSDGSSAIVTYTPPNEDPGQWQPTSPDFAAAGAAHVPFITPFAVESNSQFRPPAPPELTSAEYAAAFNEAKALGSADSTERTDDQTQVAMLWRVPLTNHVVWNRIAQDITQQRNISVVDSARLFALMNMAMNDGLQNSFESKYHYALWRPVTAIQRADEDGNPATQADPDWTSLHPTTPPYPTYAGNAATVGAACATVLAGVFGGDAVAFDVHWDSYGFPGVTRSYTGFSAVADEEARSRVYGGIHFTFDSVAGQSIGANVGNYVMDHFLAPWDGRAFQLSEAGQGGSEGSGSAAEGVIGGQGLLALDVSAVTSAGAPGTTTETLSQTTPAAPAGDSGSSLGLSTGDGLSAGIVMSAEAHASLDLLWAALGDDLESPLDGPLDGIGGFRV